MQGMRSRALCAILGGWFLVAAGCSSAPPVPERPSADALLREAQLARAERRYPAAGRAFVQAAGAADLEGRDDVRIQSEVYAGECFLAADDASSAWQAFSRARAGLEQETRAAWYPVAWLKTCAGLGDLDLAAGRLDNARVHYEEALQVARADARDAILLRLAVTAERAGDTGEGARLRTRIVDRKDPQLLALAYRLGSSVDAPRRTPAAPVAPAPAEDLVGPVHCLTRADWSARPSRANFDPMGRPYRITVHHTGDYFTSTSRQEATSLLQRIQRHHQDNNGWADIGYHYLIDPSGRVWQGRTVTHQGAHAGSSDLNRGNVGIALLGNFSEQPVTAAQQESLTGLLTDLMTRFHIPANHVYTHQDVPGRLTATECPGTALQRALPGILQRVERNLAATHRGGAPSGSLAAQAP